jgi:hypothetical protein
MKDFGNLHMCSEDHFWLLNISIHKVTIVESSFSSAYMSLEQQDVQINALDITWVLYFHVQLSFIIFSLRQIFSEIHTETYAGLDL